MIEIRSFLLLIPLILQGCKNSNPEYTIHPQLSPIVDAFMEEAASRGVELGEKKGDFIIQFGKIEGGKSGSCKPNRLPKIITIDSISWKFINAAQREALVFHELAHCLLLRQHNNEAFEFGECKSWMRESDSSCHINLHNMAWREYYIDELFSASSAPPPYWYKSEPHLPKTADLTLVQSIKIPPFKFAYFDSPVLNSFDDWIIDITAVKPQTGQGAIGLRINELALETSFAIRGGNSHRSILERRMVVIYNNPHRIALEAVSEGTKVKLSLAKIGNTLFIYFENVLHYIYPVGVSKIKIGAYCSFPEDHYSIKIYIGAAPARRPATNAGIPPADEERLRAALLSAEEGVIFTLLAISVACLGLFGLAAYTAEQRAKEISIRKLGASVSQVMVLMTKDFTMLVIIAFVIATPLAWYFSETWLSEFANRITINYTFVIISGSISLLIALMTIAYQSIKAARENPVNSIRLE